MPVTGTRSSYTLTPLSLTQRASHVGDQASRSPAQRNPVQSSPAQSSHAQPSQSQPSPAQPSDHMTMTTRAAQIGRVGLQCCADGCAGLRRAVELRRAVKDCTGLQKLAQDCQKHQYKVALSVETIVREYYLQWRAPGKAPCYLVNSYDCRMVLCAEGLAADEVWAAHS